jgi:hypothetical protein
MQDSALMEREWDAATLVQFTTEVPNNAAPSMEFNLWINHALAHPMRSAMGLL